MLAMMDNVFFCMVLLQLNERLERLEARNRRNANRRVRRNPALYPTDELCNHTLAVVPHGSNIATTPTVAETSMSLNLAGTSIAMESGNVISNDVFSWENYWIRQLEEDREERRRQREFEERRRQEYREERRKRLEEDWEERRKRHEEDWEERRKRLEEDWEERRKRLEEDWEEHREMIQLLLDSFSPTE